jgi:hypothetical protein
MDIYPEGVSVCHRHAVVQWWIEQQAKVVATLLAITPRLGTLTTAMAGSNSHDDGWQQQP